MILTHYLVGEHHQRVRDGAGFISWDVESHGGQKHTAERRQASRQEKQANKRAGKLETRLKLA
jgi:hypothetical protein